MLLLASFSTLTTSAQQTTRNPEEQPRKIKREPKKAYVEWINDVELILTTLRPAADAEYVLIKNGKELSKHLEDWRQINDAGQRLTLARLIDSRSLEPGEYQIQIRIRDHVSGQTITPSATFTIVP